MVTGGIRITEAETSNAYGCPNFSAHSFKNIDILCRLYTLPVVGYTCNFLREDGMGKDGSAKKKKRTPPRKSTKTLRVVSPRSSGDIIFDQTHPDQ